MPNRRRLRLLEPSDLESAFALFESHACAVGRGRPFEDFARTFDRVQRSELGEHCVAAGEVGSGVVGFGYLEHRDMADGSTYYGATVWALDGAADVFSELVNELHQRAARVVAAVGGSEPWFVIMRPDNSAEAEILESLGLKPVVTELTLHLGLRGELPAVRPPSHVRLSSVLEDDFAALWSAHRQGYADHATNASDSPEAYHAWERVARRAVGDGLAVVAANGDVIVGQALGWFGRFAPSDTHGTRYRCWAQTLSAAPKSRGSGLGRALLLEIAARAQRAAAHDLALTVEVCNAPARSLYRALGFEYDHSESLFGTPM